MTASENSTDGSFPLQRSEQTVWIAARLTISLFLLTLALVYAVHAILLITFPFQVEFGEGSALVYADAIRQGQSPYQSLDHAPYSACPYTPLYFFLSGILMGPEPNLFTGRLLEFLASLATAFLIGNYVRSKTEPWTGLFSVALFFSSALVLNWSMFMRVDLLALFLTISGLIVAEQRKSSLFWLSAGIFASAFFVKQSFIAAPAATFVFLLGRTRTKAVYFLALYLSLIAGTSLLLNQLTDGQFLLHTVTLNGKTALDFSTDQLLSLIGPYGLSVFPLLLLTIYGIASRRGREEPLFHLYLLFSTMIAVGSGRTGGFYNYFLEFHAALCILATLQVRQMSRLHPGRAWLVCLVCLIIPATVALPPYLYSPYQYLRYETAQVVKGQYPTHLSASFDTIRYLPYFARHGGPVLVENQANAVLYAEPPWLCDPSYFTMFINSGEWDEAKLIKPIEDQEFGLITLQVTHGNGRFTANVIEAILNNYEKVDDAAKDQIFVRKSR